MKRIVVALLLAVLLLPLATAHASGAPEKITILYPGEESDRMTEFLRGEFAERMLADLNLEVTMIYLPWDQYWDHKDIMLASLEPIDLYWDGLPNLSTMINKQHCQPLDELIAEYGQDMLKVLPMTHIRGGMVDGVIYGIPTAYVPSSGMRQFVCLRQDLLEAVGMESVSTAEDLFNFGKAAREMFPEIKGGGDVLLVPLTRYFADEQLFWIAYGELVVFGEETHKAYSYFETETFERLCRFNGEMTAANLYSDDETLLYNERTSRLQTGNYLWTEGSLGKDQEIIEATRSNTPEARLGNYLLAPDKPRYISSAGGEVLCIPYSAPNPSGAMRFLNWLYSSQENYNFAIYGVEGVDYRLVDGRVERLVGNDFFYEWMFHNTAYKLFSSEVPQSYIDTYKTWDEGAAVSKAFGFRFNNENVKEIEVRLVELLKNAIPLYSGYTDFDTGYPVFLKQLKDAGIDEYVAEVQRQLDEFLAQG